MKKIFYTLAIIVVLCLAAFVLVRVNLPLLCSFLLGKVLNSEVRISEAGLGYKEGIVDLQLRNVRIKGAVEGTIGNWKIALDATKGVYFKSVAISGFDVTIAGSQQKKRYLPFAAELLELKSGTVTYEKQKFTVSEVIIENMNIGKPFSFRADVGHGDYFGRIKIAGGGTYKAKQVDIKGQVEAYDVDIAKLGGPPKGRMSGQGTFALNNKQLQLNGQFGVTDFELHWNHLKKPLFIQKLRGDVSISATNNIMDVSMSNIIYQDTPFNVTLSFENQDIRNVELSSGFLNIRTLKEQVSTKMIGTDLWDNVQDGRAKIKKLLWDAKRPFTVDLELDNLSITYKEVNFNGVGGLLSLQEQVTKFSNMNGFTGSSRFYDFNGTIVKGNNITAKGKYSVNLRDIPSALNLGDLKFRDGTTNGSLEIEGKESTGYRISGAGKLENADVAWKRVSVSASGSYRFVNDEITFDPLILSKDGTNITIRGKWNKKSLNFLMKGSLDSQHLKPYVKTPFDASGLMVLDVGFSAQGDVFHIAGGINMDDLSFEFPGILRKAKGIVNTANFDVNVRGKDVYVNDLRYALDTIKLGLKGKIEDKKISMDIAMNVDGVEKITHLFFFQDQTARGDIQLKISMRDLVLPLKKLPYMNGYLRVNNGFLRLPWLKRPLRKIDLLADFKGDAFDVVVNGLTCGTSTLRKGELHIKGLEAPQFTMSVDMNHLNPRDFQDEYEGKIPVIREDNIIANMTGDIAVKIKTVETSKLKAEDLEVNAVLSDRKISVAQLRVNAYDGQIDLHGIADLSGLKPYIYVNGRLNRIKSGLFLQAAGSKQQEIDGRVYIYGNLNGTGDTFKTLISKADGNMTVYSRDGVIKKWNLLAKTFGALNLYDLLRGKIDFDKNGLSYTKMGAVFTVNKGVFHTDNFLIDSPSMVITGKGDVNFNSREVDASLQVAPLVTLDRTIDKIPVIRNILKRKGGGFLYMACTVSGPLDDPAVKISFINSIGGKPLELLRNILFLPVEVFE